jgi:hypothetical protein
MVPPTLARAAGTRSTLLRTSWLPLQVAIDFAAVAET